MIIQASDPQYELKYQARQALFQVIDPELFVNIIDLGLVYDVVFEENNLIHITMTLSTQHCPLGEAIQAGVDNALRIAFPGSTTKIDIVWEPLWSLDMVSSDGRALLGMPPRQ